MAPEAIGLVAGTLFLLIAVIGGGFTVKEIEIPKVPVRARWGSAFLGVLFVVLSGYFLLTNSSDPAHDCRQPHELPSVAEGDRSEDAARTDLESRGFRNVIVKPVFSPGAPRGVVVEQEPASGAILCPRDPVTIKVTR